MDIAVNSLSPVLTKPSGSPVSGVYAAAGASSEAVNDKLAQRQGKVSPEDSEQTYEQVDSAITSIQSFVQNIQRDLNFSVDDSSGRVVVKVTDRASGDVIRQLPSEEALRLAESLEEARSLLFKAEA
ncbi:flagellar protein FlaG [Pseudomonas sp. CNPSo 3701]|uniref:flagellar protein FlaG n=1 Tax=Pseudomonas sp. CNPSo 3701 TaxID=3027943 RepID=UPI002363B546|nr:flagellar protein FlaG [Pseudomonas sp. CNPSo 3701]MDD1507790.1 flagellar protein FlaG [Pseudomonas sp. CNPSo 3701]